MADEGLSSQITKNVVIIDNIIKFSDFNDLKSLRLINNLWNEVVSPKLFKKSAIILRTRRKNHEALQYFANYTNDMKQRTINLQIIADSISSVELRQKESNIWNKILENISLHVENLVLSPRNLFKGRTTYFIPRNDIEFPKVIQLDLGNHELDIVQIYPDFYNHFPNLKELIVSHLAQPGFVLSPLINIEDGSRLLSLAPNLNSLTIRSPMSLKSLQLLADFPQKWVKLDLALPNDSKDPSPIATKLEQLLEQNKSSLVCLKLKDYKSFETATKTSLKLPNCFPNLRELEIVFLKLNFNIKPISYCNMFPSLDKLFVKLVWILGDNDIDMWKTFFPRQICKTLKILKIDVDLKHFYSKCLKNQGVERNWHSEMFPNARIVLMR